MTDRTDDLLPEGLEDRLPQSARAAARVEAAMMGVLDDHGYDRVRPPLVEFEGSFAHRMAMPGGEREIRNQFRFIDPASLRMLALRSDITVQLGRIAATGLAGQPRPLRLCYAGQVVRIRGDQLDPRRESLQVGAELVGSDSAAAAAEILELAISALETAGVTGISVDLTLPDLVDTLSKDELPLDPSQVADVQRELDAKDAAGLRAVGGEAYLPLLYAAGPFAEAVAKLDTLDAGGVLDSRIHGLRQIADRVGDRASVTLDPSERHGFEYQSWFGFTLYAQSVRGALGRGGTYTIAGSGEPATGFSLYPEDYVEAVKADEPSRDTVFLPVGHDAQAAAKLRSDGWRTIAALGEEGDGKALGCSHILQNGEVLAY